MQFSTSIPATKQTITMITTVFTLGIIALVALGLALLIGVVLAAVYVIDLALTVLSELVGHIASIYAHGDSFTQLLIILVLGYIVFRCTVPLVRHIRAVLEI
jgi:hypothetical protein